MRRIPFALLVIGLLASACSNDVYGDRCPDWIAIYENGLTVEVDSSSSDAKDARKNEHCPVDYICALNGDKQRICRKVCDENSQLCNDKCLKSDEYKFSFSAYEDLKVCVAEKVSGCSENCKNGCNADGSCIKSENCLNGVDANGACQCHSSCPDNCDEKGACKDCKNGQEQSGACICPYSCANGCNADGSCIKSENCLNGVDDKTGECQCHSSCPNNCDKMGVCRDCKNGQEQSGACTCPDSCANGCNADGSCIKSENCLNGVDDKTGECQCHSSCPNNCDNTGACRDCKNGNAESGKCICDEACQNGCDEVGATCKCPLTCEGGCDETGSKCTCEASCVAGSSCDESTGRCSCIEKCKNGCDETGNCEEACENVECTGQNEQCKAGECIDLCADITCQPDEYCRLGKCALIDANGNHLHDQYENAANLGNDCRKDAECDSEVGEGDGFCDSFIGYKCSTRCISDDQCVKHINSKIEPYQYYCRPDGRCAPNAFVTVWNTKNSKTNNKLVLPTSMATKCDFKIDWGDKASEELKECKDLVHQYKANGTYTVTITGTLEGFGWDEKFGQASAEFSQNLTEVRAFGPVVLGQYAFAGCSNLKKVSKVDIPYLPKGTDLSQAFMNASVFNDSLEHWDVRNVKSFRDAFNGCSTFNQPLNRWDTSNVTDMHSMFENAKSFDQDISSWDVSNVNEGKFENIFKDSNISEENYCKILNAWKKININISNLGLDFECN